MPIFQPGHKTTPYPQQTPVRFSVTLTSQDAEHKQTSVILLLEL